jgi:hypothetical protein
MIDLQPILNVLYTESGKTDKMCRNCFNQFKAERTCLKILPSETMNDKCSVCERLKVLERIKKPCK